MGRQTKLTPELCAAIVQAVEDGVPRAIAAQAAGVAESTLYRWLVRGKQQKSGIYCEFREFVKKAEAVAVARNVRIIRDAAITTWQAAAWWLERRYHNEFGVKRTNEHTGKGGGPITTQTITVVERRPDAGSDAAAPKLEA